MWVLRVLPHPGVTAVRLVPSVPIVRNTVLNREYENIKIVLTEIKTLIIIQPIIEI